VVLFIPRLRRLQHAWPTRLLFLVVFAGLLTGPGFRGTAHSHDVDEMGQAHHVLLTADHDVPHDVPDEETAAAMHFHYSASLAFVDASAPEPVQAAFQSIGVLRVTEDLTPPSRDAEAQHRPPIA
jgi:hypothetical protein